jgi:hypothetical protein
MTIAFARTYYGWKNRQNGKVVAMVQCMGGHKYQQAVDKLTGPDMEWKESYQYLI